MKEAFSFVFHTLFFSLRFKTGVFNEYCDATSLATADRRERGLQASWNRLLRYLAQACTKQFAQLIGEKITMLQISVNTTAKQAAATLLIKKTKYETPLLFICANCVAGTNSV